MAVSAIIPSVCKVFSDTLVLVNYLVTSGERGVKGRVFSLSWRSKYGTGAERGKEMFAHDFKRSIEIKQVLQKILEASWIRSKREKVYEEASEERHFRSKRAKMA